MEYAPGAARHAATASAATARLAAVVNRPTTSSSAAAPTPPTATAARNHGSHSSFRANNTAARMALTATVPASAVAARMSKRCRHNSVAPIPITAAMAGASATV